VGHFPASGGGGGGAGYASLTGTGETTPSGTLTQGGPLTVDGILTLDGGVNASGTAAITLDTSDATARLQSSKAGGLAELIATAGTATLVGKRFKLESTAFTSDICYLTIYPGNPNGAVTAVGTGTWVIDVGSPALWMSTAAGKTHWRKLSPTGPAALWITGYWYGYRLTSANVAVPFNEGYWLPFVVQRTFTMTAIGTYVSTGLASSTLRFAVYADSGHGKPKARLLTAGTVSSATTGAKTIAVSTLALVPGTYWLAMAHQGITGTLDVRRIYNSFANASVNGIPTLSTSTTSTFLGWKAATITGAFPTTAPALTAVFTWGTIPAVLAKSA
jgi:hypothetical protein